MVSVLTLKHFLEWNRFYTLLHQYCDIYFTPKYYSLYQIYGDGEAHCFIFEKDGNIALYPFLKNPITPLGYQLDKEYYDIQGAYGYNGLIATTDNVCFINDFWREFDAYCQENDIIAEFMRFHPLLNNQKLASPKMKTFFSRHTIALDLSLSLDEIWMHQFSSKNRNMIRKAIKSGVEINHTHDVPELFEVFRDMYNKTMDADNAIDYYYFSKEFYESIHRDLCDNYELFYATIGNEIIAMSIMIFANGKMHYHLSGSRYEYRKLAASNLLLYKAALWGHSQGFKLFHLGGGVGSEEDSLYKFKAAFNKHSNTQFSIGKQIFNIEAYEKLIQKRKSLDPSFIETSFFPAYRS